MKMNKDKIAKLEKAGWSVGDFGDAFGLSESPRFSSPFGRFVVG